MVMMEGKVSLAYCFCFGKAKNQICSIKKTKQKKATTHRNLSVKNSDYKKCLVWGSISGFFKWWTRGKTKNTPNHGRKQKEKETNLCLTKQSHAIKMMDVLVPGVEFETSCWEKGSPENKLPNYFLQPDF